MIDDYWIQVIKGLTVKQQNVLSRCAIGEDGMHHPKTLAKLVDRGLLVPRKKVHYSDIFGMNLTVIRHDVPVDVHMAWAQRCSEQEISE